MNVKSSLGVAYEHAMDSILIFTARHEGLGFWPTLDAKPDGEPLGLGPHIETVLKQRKEEISVGDTNILWRIIRLSEREPLAAYRQLSQTKIKFADKSYLKQLVFARMYEESNFRLDLNDPHTRTILTAHLGRIPDFSPFKRRPIFLRRASLPTPAVSSGIV